MNQLAHQCVVATSLVQPVSACMAVQHVLHMCMHAMLYTCCATCAKAAHDAMHALLNATQLGKGFARPFAKSLPALTVGVRVAEPTCSSPVNAVLSLGNLTRASRLMINVS